MKFRLFRVFTAILFTVAAVGAAQAQGSFFTSLSGTVVDTSAA